MSLRPWRARPHAEAVLPVVAGRRVSRALTPGKAVVIVRTSRRARDPRSRFPGFRPARPLTPVVRVDGRPVSWGWGETRVELDPGPHAISVHSSHTRHHLRVDVAPGTRRILYYADVLGATAHEAREAGAMDYDRSGLGEGRSPALPLLAAAVVIVAAVSLVWTLGLIRAAMWLGLLLGFGIAGVAVVRALRQRASSPSPGAGLDLTLRAEIEPLPPFARTALVGGKETMWQRWRVARVGEPAPPPCRFWLPPPEVHVDGVAVSADWERLHLPLSPGVHTLSVSLRPSPVQAPDAEPIAVVRTVQVDPDVATPIVLTARVLAVPHSVEPRLADFTASWR